MPGRKKRAASDVRRPSKKSKVTKPAESKWRRRFDPMTGDVTTVKVTVAVTGASGYLAANVIKQLTEAGYIVRGTVRDLNNAEKTRFLLEQFPSLQLYQANLLDDTSFTRCFAGADYVIHCASPFQLNVSDPQKDLVDPATKGTAAVMQAAARARTVKRVVVTSSCAAVASQALPPPDKVWTEEDWNTDSTLENGAYRLSKSLAERAAWDFVKEHPGAVFDVVTINPSFILGPPLSTRVDSTSVKFVKHCLDGTLNAQGGTGGACFGCVDVRDVAAAHVAAMQRPSANGRYVLSSADGYSHLELATFLQDGFSEYPLPTKQLAEPTHRPKYSAAKAEKELGIKLRPVKQSILDMAESLVTKGMV